MPINSSRLMQNSSKSFPLVAVTSEVLRRVSLGGGLSFLFQSPPFSLYHSNKRTNKKNELSK